MTRDELQRLVSTHLDRESDPVPWSGQPGAVLYSGLASIRPGRFYLMGINPGGDDGPAISDNLCAPDGNHYADQCWAEGCRSRLQKRVCDLIVSLGVEPKNMPSTNLAFGRSPELARLPNAREWFRRCWPVHQALLRQVRPAWIVMLGYGAAYYFLSGKGVAGPDMRIKEGSHAA